jgi:16S rRNA (uracil1498-N3)-methyltransferase
VREWDPERVESAAARLRSVAREAAMQSHQPFITEVVAGTAIEQAMAYGGDPVLMLHPAAVTSLSAALPPETWGVRLLIGPEGGFSEREFEAAGDAGVNHVSLGAGTLRTETAAIVGAVLALAHYGRLG